MAQTDPPCASVSCDDDTVAAGNLSEEVFNNSFNSTTSSSASNDDDDNENDDTTPTQPTDSVGDEKSSVTNRITRWMYNPKMEGGKRGWKDTLGALNLADGTKRKGGDGIEQALETLERRVEEKEWKFETTPLEPFGATVQDLLRVFLLWTCKEVKEQGKIYNASKALRRLGSYVKWMSKHKADLEEPLTTPSIQKTAKLWNFQFTHDKNHRLIWWIDFDSMDLRGIKEQLSVRDSLRYFVWVGHFVMFDHNVQGHGMAIVQDLGRKGPIETFTMVPIELGTQIDRLTMGVLPVRVQACYILGAARWMRVVVNLMKPFMSRKMRQRIILVKKNDDAKQIVGGALGEDCVPKDFRDLGGTAGIDVLSKHLADGVVEQSHGLELAPSPSCDEYNQDETNTETDTQRG